MHEPGWRRRRERANAPGDRDAGTCGSAPSSHLPIRVKRLSQGQMSATRCTHGAFILPVAPWVRVTMAAAARSEPEILPDDPRQEDGGDGQQDCQQLRHDPDVERPRLDRLDLPLDLVDGRELLQSWRQTGTTRTGTRGRPSRGARAHEPVPLNRPLRLRKIATAPGCYPGRSRRRSRQPGTRSQATGIIAFMIVPGPIHGARREHRGPTKPRRWMPLRRQTARGTGGSDSPCLAGFLREPPPGS